MKTRPSWLIRLEELLIGRMHEQRPKMHFQAVMKVAGLIIVIYCVSSLVVKNISLNMRYLNIIVYANILYMC